MGKGNRNSQKRILENQANSQKNIAKQKKADAKKNTDKAVTAALAVVALIMVTVLVVSLLASNGVFIRAEAAMTSANVTVDSAMMNFFFNNYLSTWYSNYSSYINSGYFSINPAASLKSQTYGKGYEVYFLGSYTGTWYNYFLDAVAAEVQAYVLYAEGAYATGISLDGEDYAEIDELIASIKASLKENKASFSDWYGKGVKESDVRRAYELVFLAEKFMEYKQEKLEAALDADDSALKKYVEDNKATFYTADVLKYVITTASKNFGNDNAYDAARKLALEAGNKIGGATSPEEFIKLIKEYEDSKKNNTSTGTGTTTTEAPKTETTEAPATETTESVSPASETVETTDAPIDETTEAPSNETTEAGSEEVTEAGSEEKENTLEEDIKKYKNTITYNVSDDLGKWLFADDAKIYTSKVIDLTTEKSETVKGETKPDGTKTEDKKITYRENTVTVYFIVETMHLDKDLTKNAGYFISSDKAIVEQFLAGIKGEVENYEDFKQAAEDFYDDYHKDHDHSDSSKTEPTIMFDGIEELQDGYFPDSYSNLGDWIDANDRENDTYSEIFTIKVDDKTTYYGFGYFDEFGRETWYVNAYAYTLDDQFKAWTKEQEKITPVTSNNKALANSITPLVYGVASINSGHEGHDH